MVAAVVEGVAAACRDNGCALLGGETAEMPQVYLEAAFDLAGTIVGVVDHPAMLPRPDVAPGDAILALPSSGLHTNGYSLARRIAAGLPEGYAARPTTLGGTSLGEALLAVHRSYLRDVETLRAVAPLKALAHITGGGLFDNLPRVLPAGCGARIERGSWEIPPIFRFLCEQGQVAETEAFHVFNMGLGMLALLPASAVDAALSALPEARLVGIVTSAPGVQLA
jgi:phosphoribosylformylglycinamidine cyclo-ligase